MRHYLVVLLLAITCACYSQNAVNNTDTSLAAVSLQTIEETHAKSLEVLNKKYSKLVKRIQSQNVKVLQGMQKQEKKLQGKLTRIDSSKSILLFKGIAQSYQSLIDKTNNPVTGTNKENPIEYIPRLDSLITAFSFLNKLTGNYSLPTDKVNVFHNTGK